MRTTVDIDGPLLERAQAALGTEGLSATVNAALRESVRRRALAAFDVVRDVDVTPAQAVAFRAERDFGDADG